MHLYSSYNTLSLLSLKSGGLLLINELSIFESMSILGFIYRLKNPSIQLYQQAFGLLATPTVAVCSLFLKPSVLKLQFCYY